MIWSLKIFSICSTVVIILVFLRLYTDTLFTEVAKQNISKLKPQSECEMDTFDDFDNVRGTKTGCYLVPNIVHFLRFGQDNVSFVDAVCILAALKHQRPDKIYIHTDVGVFRGKYWEVLLDTPGFKEKLIIKFTKVPSQIFGQTLSKGWRKYHGGDVTRLKILIAYGGIFLDNDSYIVRSLDDLRRYELTLGWMDGECLANQVVLANKNARFLKKWLNSYKEYDKDQWYYNAGIKPTREILEKHPELVHREKILLANHHITRKLYLEKWPEWRTHYAIHLLINHQYIIDKNISALATYPVIFTDENIRNYPVTFKDMVYDVYPLDYDGLNIVKELNLSHIINKNNTYN